MAPARKQRATPHSIGRAAECEAQAWQWRVRVDLLRNRTGRKGQGWYANLIKALTDTALEARRTGTRSLVRIQLPTNDNDTITVRPRGYS